MNGIGKGGLCSFQLPFEGTMPRVIEGKLDATGLRFGIVASRFNSYLVESLLSGALDVLKRHGAKDDDITVAHVPGSLEIPAAAKKLIASARPDAVIGLGVVIRGATSHYDLVCNQTAAGLATLGLSSEIPVIFGVVTTDTIEQAIERCGTKAGNKGSDAAVGAIEMAQLYREIAKLKG